MKNSVPPWTRGDFRGVLGAVTDNLVWVVDPETHPGASRPREVFSRLHLRATPPREVIFKAEQPHRGQPATAGCLERAG
jgi:hypothetical protein